MRGVVAYFEGVPRDIDGSLEWCRANYLRVAFTPEQIVAASAECPDWPCRMDKAGVYFLQRRGKICYVGKAVALCARIDQHRQRNRPFDRVTVIAGLPPDWAADFEGAYLEAWSPPWNFASHSGWGEWIPDLAAVLAAMPQDLICNLPESERLP